MWIYIILIIISIYAFSYFIESFEPGDATTALPNDATFFQNISSGTYDLPKGLIIAYSPPTKNLADIPIGWVTCDGNNGTPDLRDKFIYFQIGSATGGSNTIQLSTANLPAHHHAYRDRYYSETVDELTAWFKDTGQYGGAWRSLIPCLAANGNDPEKCLGYHKIDTGEGQNAGYDKTNVLGSDSTSYSNSGYNIFALPNQQTSSTGSGATIDIRPPYVALVYLMKS